MTAHLGAVTDLPPVSADSDEAGERTREPPGEGEDVGFSDTLLEGVPEVRIMEIISVLLGKVLREAPDGRNAIFTELSD